MNYIDKEPHESEGRAFSDDYINSCKISEPYMGTRYANIRYEDFRKCMAGQYMTNLLYEIQGGYCCYCMRKLNVDDVLTLEHIVPQSIKKSVDLNLYANLPVYGLRNLQLTIEFSKKYNDDTRPPYPHTVAYENFLLSCNGSFPDKNGDLSGARCCNNKRGDKFLLPLPLYENIDDMVTYHEDGMARPQTSGSNASQIANAIAALCINCEDLKTVRRLWYLLRFVDYQTLQKCQTDRELRKKIVLPVLFKSSSCIDIDTKVNTRYLGGGIRDVYWQAFLSYSWFSEKYRSLYPVP